ncbi:MAG TPA: phosphoribosylanthranilate isomerase [Phycisphaerae bacterium]|nr:phosphoribosylanthranilate isomerase [Phycisphaerae bacterium]
MRVKVCGITCVEDALAAAEAGADAIGLNFVGGPRQIQPEYAGAVLEALPPLVTPVALVRLQGGAIPDELLELLGRHWVSHIQVYGDYEAEHLTILADDGFRPMPVVAVADPAFAVDAGERLGLSGDGRPSAVVLDAHDPSREGGTGRSFPWGWVRDAQFAGQMPAWPPIILAGGLRPDNVAEAVRTVHPYGVDVSSGVEVEGHPGRKDPAGMREFVRQARAAPAYSAS